MMSTRGGYFVATTLLRVDFTSAKRLSHLIEVYVMLVVGLTLYRGLCPDAWNDPNVKLSWPQQVSFAAVFRDNNPKESCEGV